MSDSRNDGMQKSDAGGDNWRPPESGEEASSRVLTALITFLVHATPVKPPDPVAWEALTELERLRRHYAEITGGEVQDIRDPQGRMIHFAEKGGGR